MISTKEAVRKLIHIVTGLLIVILIDLNLLKLKFLLIFTVLISILFLLQRLIRIPFRNLIEKAEREQDVKKYAGKGILTFFIGITLSLILFEKNIALASIMILTIGDAVSPLLGQFVGKTKNPLNNKKFIEGTIFGILAAFIGAAIFVNYLEALIASTIALIVESLDLKFYKNLTLDDNITIPLIAGITITLLKLIF